MKESARKYVRQSSEMCIPGLWPLLPPMAGRDRLTALPKISKTQKIRLLPVLAIFISRSGRKSYIYRMFSHLNIFLPILPI